MPGLGSGHRRPFHAETKTWMAGTSPAMTTECSTAVPGDVEPWSLPGLTRQSIFFAIRWTRGCRPRCCPETTSGRSDRSRRAATSGARPMRNDCSCRRSSQLIATKYGATIPRARRNVVQPRTVPGARFGSVSKTASRATRHPLPLKRFCPCGRPTPEAREMRKALSMDWARLCPPYRD